MSTKIIFSKKKTRDKHEENVFLGKGRNYEFEMQKPKCSCNKWLALYVKKSMSLFATVSSAAALGVGFEGAVAVWATLEIATMATTTRMIKRRDGIRVLRSSMNLRFLLSS